jgi:hypothetical protein
MIAGVFLGWCMLLRPMYLLFYPFAMLIIFAEERNIRLAFRRGLLYTFGCLVVVAPWSLYSSIRAGTPIIVSANGGETLSGGLNPQLIADGYRVDLLADGRTTWTGPGKWINPWSTGYLSPAEQALPYLKQDSLLRRRTLQWVAANPGPARYLERAKLSYMWGFQPFSLRQKETIFGNLPVLAFLILSLAAILRFRSQIRQLSRFWTLPIFVTCVALLSWGSWRFREPGDIGLLMLGSLFICSLFSAKDQSSSHAQDPGSPVRRSGQVQLEPSRANSVRAFLAPDR